MLDLHAHILPGIDDGPRTLGESVALVEAFVADGVDHIVATPHVYPGVFDNQWSSIAVAYNLLADELDRRHLDIGMSFACEVRLHAEMFDALRNGDLPVFLGAQRKDVALLVELPDGIVPVGAEAALRQLAQAGVTPVLAHPERNRAIMQSPEKAGALVRAGCRLQVTSGSLLGEFGDRAQTTARRLLEAGWVSVVASDAHNLRSRPPRLSAAHDWLSRHFNADLADELTVRAPIALAGGYAVSVGAAGVRLREMPRRYQLAAEDGTASRPSTLAPLVLTELPDRPVMASDPDEPPDRQWPTGPGDLDVPGGLKTDPVLPAEWVLPDFGDASLSRPPDYNEEAWQRAFEDTVPTAPSDLDGWPDVASDRVEAPMASQDWQIDAAESPPDSAGTEAPAHGPLGDTRVLQALTRAPVPPAEFGRLSGLEPPPPEAAPGWAAFKLSDLPVLTPAQRVEMTEAPVAQPSPEPSRSGSTARWWSRWAGTGSESEPVPSRAASPAPIGLQGMVVPAAGSSGQALRRASEESDLAVETRPATFLRTGPIAGAGREDEDDSGSR